MDTTNIYNPLQPNSPYSIFTSSFGQPVSTNILPHMDITKVTGKKGAEKFEMGPNSSALLLDLNDPLVWFVSTDGAGYKTILPYKITPYEPDPEPDVMSLFNKLNQRLTSIEERMNSNESNRSTSQQQQQSQSEQPREWRI